MHAQFTPMESLEWLPREQPSFPEVSGGIAGLWSWVEKSSVSYGREITKDCGFWMLAAALWPYWHQTQEVNDTSQDIFQRLGSHRSSGPHVTLLKPSQGSHFRVWVVLAVVMSRKISADMEECG